MVEDRTQPLNAPTPQWWPTAAPRRIPVVLALYGLLACLYTWPLATRLTSHIPGEEAIVDVGRDPALQSWFFWRTRTALTDADEDLLYSRLTHGPRGMEMTLQPNMLLQAAASLLIPGASFHTALNLVLLLSFVLSGLTAYLLGRHVLGHEAGALLCGAIYAFCPYRGQHLVGHYQLMDTALLPLVALALLRAAQAPGWRSFLAAGLAIAATVLTDYYTFAYALLWFGWTTLYRVVARRHARPLVHALWIGAIAFVLASPVLVPALRSAAASDYLAIGGHERHKADLLSFVVPSARQWLFTSLQPALRSHLDMDAVDGVEHSVYLGIGLLVLCLAVRRQLWRDAVMRGMVIAALVFAVLALGPELGIDGRSIVPLPGQLLAGLPFFESARAPGRIVVLTMLALALCAGFAVRQLLRPGVRWAGLPGWAVAAGASGLLGLEYAMPIQLAWIEMPRGLQTVTEDPVPGVAVHAPLYPPSAALAQAWHGRPTLMTALGRVDPAVQQYYWRHEALRVLAIPHGPPDPAAAARAVDLLGLRYILWNRDIVAGASDADLQAMARAWGMEPVHVDRSLAVHRRTRPRTVADAVTVEVADPDADLHLVYGWSNRQRHAGEAVAWMLRRESQVAVPAMAPGRYRLRLSVLVLCGAETAPTLEVRTGDRSLATRKLASGHNRIEVAVTAGALRADRTNVLTLRASLRVGRPHRTGLVDLGPDGHAPLEVGSGGQWTANQGHAAIVSAGQRLEMVRPGVLVAAVDPGSGQALAYRTFLEDGGETAAQLRAWVDGLDPGATVAVAVRTSPYLRDGNLGTALAGLGVPPDLEVGRLNSFALIGWRDRRPPLFSTGAVEAAVGIGALPVTHDAAVGLLRLELAGVEE